MFDALKELTLNLSDWGNFSEIASAVAVIASLIYVSFQVKENTIAIKSSTNQEKLNYGRAHSELLITNPNLVKVVLKAEHHYPGLTDEEHAIFYEFTVWRLAGWEHAYLEYTEDIVDKELWAAWDAVYRHVVLGKPGYVDFFNNTRPEWDSRFMKHVDSIIGNASDT